MKKLIALLLILATFLFVAVSCGNDKTTEEKAKTTPAPATETVEETTPGGLQVTEEGGVVTFEW